MAVDDRTYPVLFATWVGHSSLETMRAFYEWNDTQLKRVVADNVRFALITDAIDAERPNAPVRQMIADKTKEMQRTHVKAEALRTSSIVVVENPFVRGALTAVGWLMGGMETEYAANLPEAITRTEGYFRAKSASWPVGLTPNGYRRAKR